jgi:hypothetical protein
MPALRSLTLSLFMFATSPVGYSALADPLSSFQGCFVRNYPRIGAGNLAEIRAAVRPTLKDGPVFSSIDVQQSKDETSSVDVSFRFWSLPNITFGVSNFHCPRIDGKITCTLECDYGSISFSPLINGDLLIESHRIAPNNGGMSSLLLEDSLDSFSLRGTHTLRRAEASQCQDAGQTVATGGIVLQQGDYHPYVRRIATQLAKLGYLTRPVSSFFTEEVSSALKAFQQKFQLAPTGIADTATMRLLNIRTIVEGSC